MNKKMIIAILLLTGCTMPPFSKKNSSQIIPLLMGGGETITVHDIVTPAPSTGGGSTVTAAGFWAGISNNVFTVGNINTGFSKQFNSVGMINSAVLSPDCSKVYVATSGTYVYDLFKGTYTFVALTTGNMSASPDGSVIAYMVGNDLWFIYVGTNQAVKVHTFTMGSNYVSWKDNTTLYISFNDDTSHTAYHIYTVDINTWAMPRLTLTDNLNAEFMFAVNATDSIRYFVGDSGSGTSNNFWKSTNLSVFQNIPLNVARNLIADQNGQVYMAQGVVNGSTEMKMINGVMEPVGNLPQANNTIYDFCKLNPQILNQ